MRSGQIQLAIAQGVAPFALCRLISENIRTKHKPGGHIQDSIGSVFASLPQNTPSWVRNPSRGSAALAASRESACVAIAES